MPRGVDSSSWSPEGLVTKVPQRPACLLPRTRLCNPTVAPSYHMKSTRPWSSGASAIILRLRGHLWTLPPVFADVPPHAAVSPPSVFLLLPTVVPCCQLVPFE
ncbi:hypothetical protein MRX96_011658 [Rhipicephalus microplus]